MFGYNEWFYFISTLLKEKLTNSDFIYGPVFQGHFYF